MATESDDIETSRPRPTEDERLLDRRLTVLETRFDTMLPLLVTKADLAELKGEVMAKLAETKAELKAEIRAESARTSRWMATIAVAMFVGFGGMFVTMLALRPA